MFRNNIGESLELQPLKKNAGIAGGDKDNDDEVVVLMDDDNDHFRGRGEETASTTIGESPDADLYRNGGGVSWVEWFFPADVPRELQIWRHENWAIPGCYLLVGSMQGMFRPLLNVYPLQLGATEAQQTTVAAIATLPCAFKLLYGFWSDNFPLAGYRRKPYMLLGWMLSSAAAAALASTSDLSLPRYFEGGGDTGVGGNEIVNPPDDAPSIRWLSATFFLYGVGLWIADVMADSLVAQKARIEPHRRKGELQSTCYATRFFGLMVSAPTTTWLYARYGPGIVVRCLTVGPLLLLPLVYLLAEERNITIRPTQEQCEEIWKTVCSRSVWQPLGFVYVFNLLQVSNSAWRQFLKSVLGFSAADLNILLVASYVLLYAGTIAYKTFFLRVSWRRLYYGSILLNACFSALQLLLIRGRTLGLSPFLFALGDEAFAEFLVGIQFLPCAILMVGLCPAGSEGASYAMWTTMWNTAQMLAPAISTVLLSIWDVSKEALEANELDGLFNLTVLTTCIQLSPIVLVRWLPHGQEDLRALSEKQYSGSPIAGGLFLALLFGSMLYTFVVSVLNVVAPGWAGES